MHSALNTLAAFQCSDVSHTTAKDIGVAQADFFEIVETLRASGHLTVLDADRA